MDFKTKVANFFAKYSTARWNRIRVLRVMCRKLYLAMARHYRNSPEQREISRRYVEKAGNRKSDTYPWPFREPNFAPWMEEDRGSEMAQDDAIIGDELGFAVRNPTSYCAWKYYELTGKWLRCPSGFRWHAKEWPQLLRYNGFDEVITGENIDDSCHCVGIVPGEGEYGLIVWLEGRYFHGCSCMPGAMCGEYLWVSTYLPKNHSCAFLSRKYGFVEFGLELTYPIMWFKIN